MNRELESYYLKQPEPVQGCLLALKSIILSTKLEISHRRAYQIPFFYYKEKKLAFLWVNRKRLLFGIVTDSSMLELREGARRKNKYETIAIDPNEDIPVKEITKLLLRQIKLYDDAHV
ncbi:hypothetical protein ACX0G9_24660 [Flavitalea flava]